LTFDLLISNDTIDYIYHTDLFLKLSTVELGAGTRQTDKHTDRKQTENNTQCTLPYGVKHTDTPFDNMQALIGQNFFY